MFNRYGLVATKGDTKINTLVSSEIERVWSDMVTGHGEHVPWMTMKAEMVMEYVLQYPLLRCILKS